MNESSLAASGPLVIVRNLKKTYAMGSRRVDVLRGVDLEIPTGDFLVLRGASGAGKSTLLHLIGGLDVPNEGTVSIGGRNLDGLSSAELARFRNRHVGFVFQSYHLLPELDALENVCLPARMQRMDATATAQRARALLERVGLGQRADHLPAELSGGEQQRVAIARALINSPALLLADEPTGNLDSHTGEEIVALLKELRAEQRTTLVVATHDARVAAHAPRTLSLLDGCLES